MTFKKADQNKPRFSLVPLKALQEVIGVLEHGAQKYGVNNWQNVDDRTRYVDAIARHLMAYASGEQHDQETDLHHLAHAACSCLFLIALDSDKLKTKKMNQPARS